VTRALSGVRFPPLPWACAEHPNAEQHSARCPECRLLAEYSLAKRRLAGLDADLEKGVERGTIARRGVPNSC
jgi:hypothetical protein